MKRALSILLAAALAAPPAAVASDAQPTVFVGENGSRYHAAECPRLRFARPLAREEARAQGLEPCPVCAPDDLTRTTSTEVPLAASSTPARTVPAAVVTRAPDPPPPFIEATRARSEPAASPEKASVIGGILTGAGLGAAIGGGALVAATGGSGVQSDGALVCIGVGAVLGAFIGDATTMNFNASAKQAAESVTWPDAGPGAKKRRPHVLRNVLIGVGGLFGGLYLLLAAGAD